ncbi:hypothetical protein [Paenibacillus ihuae]|uniref:hypothetical protein n=1 Tax=Paenibacillus ihuae TaxID=1232431 RepID=UPI001AE0C5BD|nr:hypothetical protein [Paenibacillus ihuae]
MAASVSGQCGGFTASSADGFGGMGGGRMPGFGDGGGMGGAPDNTQQQGSISEAITTGVRIIVLLLAAAFVTFYKRKRL